jgi:hypothetical protein
LAQILSKICVLCKVRGHVLLKFGNKWLNRLIM